MVSAVRADATEVPMPKHKPLAQTVYPLQGGKVHPNFENKKFSKKFLLASTTTRKIRWIHWWNPFLNPLTIKGDICNFVTAVSALSNTSQRSVYNYARRLILRTGQHLSSFDMTLQKYVESHVFWILKKNRKKTYSRTIAFDLFSWKLAPHLLVRSQFWFFYVFVFELRARTTVRDRRTADARTKRV